MPTPGLLKEQQLQSDIITFLRFPLIVGVVMIHARLSNLYGVDIQQTASDVFPIYQSVSYLFSQILARSAVPLFLFFSGFLFFRHVETFSSEIYREKVKKRLFTLFIPYLIWNMLYAVELQTVEILAPGLIQNPPPSYSEIKYWLLVFYAPINYPLWFVKELMIVVLCSPIIFRLIKRIPILFLAFTGIVWILSYHFSPGGEHIITALFFFSLGAYFSISKIDFANLFKRYLALLCACYLLAASLTFFYQHDECVVYLKPITFLLGACFILALTAKLVGEKGWKMHPFLSDCSFFIFVFHVPILSITRRILQSIYHWETDIELTIFYFVWATSMVIIGIGTYSILRKLFPKLAAILTGGR